MAIKPTVIKHIRAVLKPRPERYDLAAVLERLVEVVREYEVVVRDDAALDQFRYDEASGKVYVEERDGGLTERPEYEWKDGAPTLKPGLVVLAGKGDPKGLLKIRGRHRDDCYLALLLAVIFYEYTGKPPTRLWNKGKKWERSHFYKFAEMVCRKLFHINRPPWSTFREACEWWKQPQPQGFSKKEMQERL